MFDQRLPSIKDGLPSKVVFLQGCLPSKVLFCQTSSSIKGSLPSNVISHQRSSSIKGLPLSKVVFHQRWSSTCLFNYVQHSQLRLYGILHLFFYKHHNCIIIINL